MKISHHATGNVQFINPETSIDEAIALMEKSNIHHLPVLEADKVVGMLSDRDILLGVGGLTSSQRNAKDDDGERVLGARCVGQIMTTPVITMSPDDTVVQAARLMIERKISALPVVENEKLVGILTDADLLSQARQASRQPGPTQELLRTAVREFMNARVEKVSPQASLTEIIETLRGRVLRHVPVVIDDRLLGIVSDRDVRRALGESMLQDMKAQQEGKMCLTNKCAQDIMTPGVRTIGPDVPLTEAIDQMRDHSIHCLPVVTGDSLEGIITHTDILRAIAKLEQL